MIYAKAPYKPVFARGRGGSWYHIEVKADTPEVHIYEEVGIWGIEAAQFVKDLKEQVTGPRMRLRINSPGGNVFDGISIYNALREHPAKVESHVDGIAASIASVIALAGDEVHMGQGTFYMIHDPWGLVVGNAGEMREVADVLDKIAGSMTGIYAEASGQEKDDIRDLMRAETWYTAEEAVEAGFADSVTETDTGAEAKWDLSVYAKVPDDLKVQKKPVPTNARELEAALREAGYSRTDARAVVAGGYRALQTPREAARVRGTAEKLLNDMRGVR